MLLSHRVTACPELRASAAVHAVVHTNYRLHAVRNERFVSEDALLTRAFDRLGAVARPIVTVVLAGRACWRARGVERWLEVGDVALLDEIGVGSMRQEPVGGTYEAINLQWTSNTVGAALAEGLSSWRASLPELERLREIARAIASATDTEHIADDVADVFEILRASGVPLERTRRGNLVEVVPEGTIRLAGALDRLVSNIGAQPMSVDIEALAGISNRHANRVVTDFNRRYAFNASNWRDQRMRRRLMVGVAWMTVPGAATERVARAVGYNGAPAFCRAMADAGLPSPGEIARTIRAW